MRLLTLERRTLSALRAADVKWKRVKVAKQMEGMMRIVDCQNARGYEFIELS